MSIITCYKSDADGKLFEDKKKYQAHLRKLASARLAEKKLTQMEAERDAFLDQMGQVKSVDELNQFIKDNWRWFWANGAQHDFYKWSSNKGKAAEFHEYHEVTICDVYWKEDLSNSHSCPRGGVENFDTRADYNKGKPTGYPGWSGRINIKVKPPMSKHKKDPYMHDGWGSSYFERTTINTGSGGGGGGKDFKSYSYDVKLFAADFPVMYEAVRKDQWIHRENQERMHIWRSVGGKGLPQSVTEADIPGDFTMSDPLKGDFSRTVW